MINFKRIRVLLQCSVTVTRANRGKLLVTNVGSFEKPKRARTSARVYCTISSNTESENPLESESDDEFETLPDGATNYGNMDYETIAENDPEKIKKLRLFQLELSILAQEGELIPKTLEPKHWKHLLLLESSTQRYGYYKILWTNETQKQLEKLRKRKNFENYLRKKEILETEVESDKRLQYGLAKNTLFYRIYPPQVHNMYNWKLLQTSLFGPDLLVDCGYEEYMRSGEIEFCAKQLLYMWSLNRESYYPFNLIFCNYKRDGDLSAKMMQITRSLYDDKFPFTYTEKHYLDLFPKEKLVYLTPHCTEIMKKYEPDCVYIIGGVVESYRCERVSLAKAKKEGLRTAKFPLDKYLNWGVSVKSLTLKECVGIVNELKNGHGWNVAFKHVSEERLAKKGESPEQAPVEERRINYKGKSTELVFELLKEM